MLASNNSDLRRSTYCVLQWKVFLGQFFKSNDNVIAGNIDPRACRDQLGSSAFILRIVEDAQWRSFHIDGVSSIDEFLRNAWCDC